MAGNLRFVFYRFKTGSQIALEAEIVEPPPKIFSTEFIDEIASPIRPRGGFWVLWEWFYEPSSIEIEGRGLR